MGAGVDRSTTPPGRAEDLTSILCRSPAVADLARRIAALPAGEGRRLVAVAGPPASGKSELAVALARSAGAEGRAARVIPMDGFHLDNALLDARSLRARKGAPETFDAPGFIALVERLRAGGEVVYPRFDRTRDLAVAGACAIAPECGVAIIEGNYLLFDEPPWRALAQLWDLSIWLEVPESVVLARCTQRWLDHDHPPAAARARAEGNDLRNFHRIVRARLPADVTVAVESLLEGDAGGGAGGLA